MRKRLQLALMATVIATSFPLTTPCVQAQARNGPIVPSTDDSGRKVFVNDAVPAVQSKRSSSASSSAAMPAPSSGLVYWSPTQRRWKAVPSAKIGAAKSAAAEVNHLLESSDAPTTSFVRGKMYTQADVDAAIDQAAARHNVDPSLVRAVIKVESNFNPNAVSRKGAMGLMQLMPQTARSLKVTNPFDPAQNVDAGVRHLKKLMESYGGDIKLSLAAYNAGQGAVARSSGVPRFAETRNYVKRITQLYYGGPDGGYRILGSPVSEPMRVQRDARGVLYVSNTD